MDIIIDTSAIIAVVANETHRARLIALTQGANLIAPDSLHWEMGNAFLAMLKRRRVTLQEALKAIAFYQKIPIRFINIELALALELAETYKIYAYDAYFIACAIQTQQAFLSLDQELLGVAKQCGIKIIEV